MYPRVRPDQIFPRPVEEYADQLGAHQAEAFRLLWNFHDLADPISGLDRAHWHLNRALHAVGNEDVKRAPRELTKELGEKSQQFVLSGKANAVDTVYIELFVIIADWQHELVDDNMESFKNDIYA